MHRGYRRYSLWRSFGRGGLVLLLLMVFVLSWVPVRGHAQEGFNLTSSPLPIDLTTTPGVPVSTPLRVQNSGTTPVKIKVSLLKFTASGDTGQPQLSVGQSGDTYMNWVSFSKTAFVAEPGVWNTITMTISPPKEAAFGYYYAVVFSQDDNLPPTATNSNRLTGATATMVLLNVKVPGEKRQLELTAFTASQKLYEYAPARFSVTVKNTGNVHAIPNGNIFISRGGGKPVAVISVNPNQGNILPASSRTFHTEWGEGFPVFTPKRVGGQTVTDKNGVTEQQLTWDFSRVNTFRIGKYKAHLLLTYSDGTRDVPLEAEVTFWVIPWKAILALIGLLIALFVFYRWSVKRAVKRHARRQAAAPKEKTHVS